MMGTWFLRATGVLLVGLLSGCGIGYKDIPLPGSKVRGEVYSVSADFEQALNLAQGAQVKLNGVSIGRVTSVTAKNYRALITMDIRSQTTIPSDSTARLRYDTPLGELIIQVLAGNAPSNMADGAKFATTNTAPSVEDALQSASTLINGGNLGELQVLATELNAAFGGREREVRDSTEQITEFVTQANASSQDISSSLQALSGVAVTLNEHRGTIRKALDDIGPAVNELGKDTDELVELLNDANRVALRAESIAGKVTDPLVEILTKLGPIADAVLSTRSVFRSSLDAVIALAAQLDKTVPSDTLPLFTQLHLDPAGLNLTGTASASTPKAAKSQTAKPARQAPKKTDVVGGTLGGVTGATDPVVKETQSLLEKIGGLLGGSR